MEAQLKQRKLQMDNLENALQAVKKVRGGAGDAVRGRRHGC